MSLGARAQGLNLAVEDALRGTLALGVLEAEGLSSAPVPAAFHEEVTRVTERLAAVWAGKPAGDIPGVAETRRMFHALHMDPTKTRPSSEALLRRVLQGKNLPDVSPAVNVCNLCSLEQQLPLGLYDRERVRGDLRVRVGRDSEGYAGIRKNVVRLADRLLLADDEGPFGAPTSDSARTSVTAETRNLLVVVYCPIDRGGDDLSVALEQIADRLSRYCGATVSAVRVVQ
jgi:DNA/RNA-binding domain of Phe-tRNA-synthetase-like protein